MNYTFFLINTRPPMSLLAGAGIQLQTIATSLPLFCSHLVTSMICFQWQSNEYSRENSNNNHQILFFFQSVPIVQNLETKFLYAIMSLFIEYTDVWELPKACRFIPRNIEGELLPPLDEFVGLTRIKTSYVILQVTVSLNNYPNYMKNCASYLCWFL